MQVHLKIISSDGKMFLFFLIILIKSCVGPHVPDTAGLCRESFAVCPASLALVDTSTFRMSRSVREITVIGCSAEHVRAQVEKQKPQLTYMYSSDDTIQVVSLFPLND